ncbi:hypothetical protein AAC387_Pa08g0500 [Persea americana]
MSYQMQDISFLLILLPLLSLFFFYCTLLKQNLNLPPGPRPWPVVGNLLQLGKHPHSSLAQMARAHGPLISLRLGTQLLVVASSPSTAAQVLKTHDRVLSARYIPHTYRVKTYIEHSLAFSFDCSEQWKRMRTVCKTELFTTRMLDAQAHMRERKVGELMGSLLLKRGGVVQLGKLVFGTVFNIMSNVVFSRDAFDLVDQEENKASRLKFGVSRALELGLVPNLADYYPSLARLDIQGLNRETASFLERIYSVWELFIGKRREEEGDNDERKHDFLSVLFSAGCSDLQLKALISDMFVAGTDTSTSVVDWTMSELMRNSKLMQKVKDELKQVVGERIEGEYAVRESHLSHLHYLQACIKESLRLHPPAPLLLPRQALEACEVMNYTIPKDCRVMVNAWAIGRDPNVWKDPLTFSPERFLNSSVDYKGKDFELAPFGAGRRMCPGLPLASRVIKLILASLIHTFDWSLPDGIQPSQLNMNERFGLTLDREQPLLLVPK